MAKPTLLADLTETGLRAKDAELAALRLVSLAMYGTPTAPRFAAIWLPDVATFPRQIFLTDEILDTSTSNLQARIDSLQQSVWLAELYPVWVTATGAIGSSGPFGVRIALVFEHLPYDPKARLVVGGTAAAIMKKRPDTAVAVDTCYATSPSKKGPLGYETTMHHFGLFHRARPTPRTRWRYVPLDPVMDQATGIQQSPQHKAVLRGWSRQHHAIPAPATSVAYTGGTRRAVYVHYRDDTFEPWPSNMSQTFDCGTFVDGPLKRELLPTTIKKRMEDEGRWPVAVGANGRHANTRFCITWGPGGQNRPLRRQFVAQHDGVVTIQRLPLRPETEPLVPPVTSGGIHSLPLTPTQEALASLDDLVRTAMRKSGVHAAQIAIAKNGRLKLARAYTWAESNYPVTRHDHKLRWGSVSKFLMAMRAAALDDPDFLAMSIQEALGIDTSELAGASTANIARFADTSVADLLRHASGWRIEEKYGYKTNYFTYGRRQLPLQPGDFARFVRGSALDFLQIDPGTLYKYNNANYVAVSEALSARLSGDGTLSDYAEAMEAWWSPSIGKRRAIVIPGAQADSLLAKEALLRGAPGVARPTVVSSAAIPPAERPDWVPSVYTGGRDYEMLASGFYSMTAATMARILQGMHPDPPDLASRLLTPAQVDSLSSRDPNISASYQLGTSGRVLAPSPVGLGGVKEAFQTIDGVKAVQFSKSGSLPDGGPIGGIWHWVWEARGQVSSLSFCGAATGDGGIDTKTMVQAVLELNAVGYFDDARDLFPDLL